MTRATPPKARDRATTEQSILMAAKHVLAEGGFQEFGINAIARRAGCDKQLIYRYFGGLEGLADAIGAELASSLAERLSTLPSTPRPSTYRALAETLVLGFLDLLQEDRLMQRIIAWELAGSSPLVARMVEARGKRLGAWMQDMRGALSPPTGVDGPAVNAVLIASVQHIVASAAANGVFAGMPLQSDADWLRLRQALVALVNGVYADRPA